MALIAAGGAIVLALGLVELIGELSSGRRDTAQIMNGVFKIGGGLAMIMISSFIMIYT